VEAPEGQPLFAAEVVRSLLESGTVARDHSGSWTLSAEVALSSAPLPETVQQVVRERLERLPEASREPLAVASVLGRSFAYRDLEAALPEVRDLDARVGELVREGLLQEERGTREDRLSFASGTV